MSGYNIQPDPHNGIICECCGHERALLDEFSHPNAGLGQDGPPAGTKVMLCEVCSNTHLSKAMEYPRMYGQHQLLFSSIGWIANEILLKIEELKTELRPQVEPPIE